MIGPVLGYPASAALMTISPYLSIGVALVMVWGVFILAFLLPETLNLEEARKHRQIAAAARAHLPKRTFSQKARAGFTRFMDSMRALLQHKAVICLLPLFLVSAATAIIMDFLMQYAAERFFWSIRNASLLPEMHSIANALLLMVILPALSHYLTNIRNMPSARKDLFIVRTSTIITMSGLILIGLAPTMLILLCAIVYCSFGAGFLAATRSILVGLTRPDLNARLFAVCSTIQYMGSAFTAPLIARIFGWSMEKGGFWLGAPFWFVGLLVAIVGIPLFVLNFDGDDEDPLAITTAATPHIEDRSDALTLVSEDGEAERERERLG